MVRPDSEREWVGKSILSICGRDVANDFIEGFFFGGKGVSGSFGNRPYKYHSDTNRGVSDRPRRSAWEMSCRLKIKTIQSTALILDE